LPKKHAPRNAPKAINAVDMETETRELKALVFSPELRAFHAYSITTDIPDEYMASDVNAPGMPAQEVAIAIDANEVIPRRTEKIVFSTIRFTVSESIPDSGWKEGKIVPRFDILTFSPPGRTGLKATCIVAPFMLNFMCSLYHGYHHVNSCHTFSHPFCSASFCISSGVFAGGMLTFVDFGCSVRVLSGFAVAVVAGGSTVRVALFWDG